MTEDRSGGPFAVWRNRFPFELSHKNAFHLRVFVSCLGMFALVLLISVLTTYASNKKISEDSLRQQAVLAGSQTANIIQSYGRQTERLGSSLKLIELMHASRQGKDIGQLGAELAKELLTSIGSIYAFQGVSLQDSDGNFLLKTTDLPRYDAIAYALDVDAMDFTDGVSITLLDWQNEPMLTITAPVEENGNRLGYLHLFYNRDFIALPQDLGQKNGLLFNTATWELMYTDRFVGLVDARRRLNASDKLLENLLRADQAQAATFHYWDENGRKMVAGFYHDTKINIATVVAEDNALLIGKVIPYSLVQMLFALLLTGLMMILLHSYSRRFYQPFRDMAERCNRMADGDDTVRFEKQSDRELNRLADAFERYRFKVEQAAYYDPLLRTGNRIKAIQDIDILVGEHPGRRFALYLVDIREFSKYNEIFSMSLGDELLKLFVEGMRSIFGDRVYRVNGDVFLGLVLDERTDLHISGAAQEILAREVALDDVKLELKYCMGVSHYPADGTQASELLENAQRALSQAKADPDLPMVVYSEEITQMLRYEDYIVALLRRRIEDGSLQFWYQPIYSVQERRFISAELLLRLQDDGGNYVRPDQVIAIMERKSQVEAISDYVLQCACRTVKRLPDDPDRFQNLKINLSVQQLIQPGFAEKALGMISRCGIRPDQIGMEVTETMLIQSFDSACSTLERLRDAGIQIALDDFGTGYSSISYLARLPLDVLKLDLQLVRQINQSVEQLELIRAVVQLARAQHMEVVAEGVGDLETLGKVVDCGADYIQGYYYAKPMPEEEFVRFILQNDGRPVEAGANSAD